jgi:archaetidylinositol phosphate synthase
MLYKKRKKFHKAEKIIGRVFSKLPLTPNQYTLLSLVFAILTFYFLYHQRLLYACFTLSLALLMDIVDGCVARFRGVSTKKGAYLDTIADRWVEIITLIGLCFVNYPVVVFPHYVWLMLLLAGGLMTTYAKAAAKEKELVKTELKGGILERFERTILILFSIFISSFSLSLGIYVLIVVAILSNISALQRISAALSTS